ncbi:MAG: hypothetical protein KAH77_06145 [Thiomargarita sp.]|nr:hypothetical protein [Thiomargarita sp.]
MINDTHPKIQEMLIEGYRRMTPGQKMQCVVELNHAVQQLALSRIVKQYGPISEYEQRLRLAALWLDRETMIRVFKWDPVKEGY